MTNNTKRFSIIVPMHNEEEFIIVALKSVTSQTWKDYECIVIDDRSTDKSKSLVNDFIKQNPNIDIKLCKTKEGTWGPGAAKNVGLDNATGEYIVFLDADDELNNEYALQNINEAIQKNDMVEVLLLGYQRKFKNRHDKTLLTKIFRPTEKDTNKHHQIGKNLYSMLWVGCWKRSLFKDNNIRCSENTVWDDQIPTVELFNAVEQKKIRISGWDKAHYTYNIRPGNSICTTPSTDKMKAAILMCKNINRLVKEGKIDKEYEKDIKFRVGILRVLGSIWMLGNAAYTFALKTIPDAVDKLVGRRNDGRDEEER